MNQPERDGALIQDIEQPDFVFCEADTSEADIQDTFNAASVDYRIAIGPSQGRKAPTLRSDTLVRTDTRGGKLRVIATRFSTLLLSSV